MRPTTSLWLGILASLALATPCAAQRMPELRFAAQPSATPTGTSAFLIEAAGGVAGSLAGFAIVYSASDRCDVEDLQCLIENAGAAVLTSTAVSAAGAYLAGTLAKTKPSGVGAVLGAIVGAAAGLGAWHLVAEELNVATSDQGGMVSYALTQGLFTAAGSAIGRKLKR